MRLHQSINPKININMTLAVTPSGQHKDQDIDMYRTAIDNSNQQAADCSREGNIANSINKYFEKITSVIYGRLVTTATNIQSQIPQTHTTLQSPSDIAQHNSMLYDSRTRSDSSTSTSSLGGNGKIPTNNSTQGHQNFNNPDTDDDDNNSSMNYGPYAQLYRLDNQNIPRRSSITSTDDNMDDNDLFDLSGGDTHLPALDKFILGQQKPLFYRGSLHLGHELASRYGVTNKIYHAYRSFDVDDTGNLHSDRHNAYADTETLKDPVNENNFSELCEENKHPEGVLGRVRELFTTNPERIGQTAIGVCGNNGQPAGALVYRRGKDESKDTDYLVVKKDWKLSTKGQEESVMRDVLSTICYNEFNHNNGAEINVGNSYEETMENTGVWDKNYREYRQVVFNNLFTHNKVPVQGLIYDPKNNRSTMTVQGIDYTKDLEEGKNLEDNKFKYGTAYVLDNAPIDITQPTYCVSLVTVSSACCNKNKKDKDGTGSMSRTLDQQAANNSSFRNETVKEALRAFFDTCFMEGKTYVQVPLVGTKIYDNHNVEGDPEKLAGKRFNNLLHEVLTEEVGDNGEKRYQYFKEISITDIDLKASPSKYNP